MIRRATHPRWLLTLGAVALCLNLGTAYWNRDRWVLLLVNLAAAVLVLSSMVWLAVGWIQLQRSRRRLERALLQILEGHDPDH